VPRPTFFLGTKKKKLFLMTEKMQNRLSFITLSSPYYYLNGGDINGDVRIELSAQKEER